MNLKSLLTGWHFMRWVRLTLSIIISIQAFQSHDYFLGFLSSVLWLQVITNAGCCGPAGCNVSTQNSNNSKTEDIEFEEIK